MKMLWSLRDATDWYRKAKFVTDELEVTFYETIPRTNVFRNLMRKLK